MIWLLFSQNIELVVELKYSWNEVLVEFLKMDLTQLRHGLSLSKSAHFCKNIIYRKTQHDKNLTISGGGKFIIFVCFH